MVRNVKVYTEQAELGKLREILRDREAGVLQSVGSQRVGRDLVAEQQEQAAGSMGHSKMGRVAFV